MKKVYIILIFTIGTVFSQVTEKAFGQVLSTALYDSDLYLDYIERNSIKDFKAILEYKKTGLNTWSAKVQSYLHTEHEYSWRTWTRNIIIKNYGTHFEAYSESNPLYRDFMKQVTSHDDYPEKNDIVDDLEGLEFTQGVSEDGEKFTFHFKYIYPSEFDDGDLEERIEQVVNFSRHILSSISLWEKEIKEEWLEETEDNPVNNLSADQFLILMSDHNLVEDYKVPNQEAYPEGIGYWSYKKSAVNISFDLILYEDKLTIYMTRKIGKNDSESDRATYVSKLVEYVKDNPVDAASESKVMFYPGYEEYFGVKSTFLFNGTIEGLALREMWTEIWDAYSEDLGDEITSIVGRE